MLKAKDSKTSETKNEAEVTVPVQNLNYFAVEIPQNIDDELAQRLRISIAEELTLVMTEMQQRYPDIELNLKYGYYTGTGMFDIPLVV